jgi:beta-glucanase (GH16 family)
MKKFMNCSIALIVLLFACGKTNSTSNEVLPPLNLTVNAIVATDNSGNVSFTASATNATTYEYDFGNGVFQIVPSGIVTYKYTNSGTYTVNVIAKNSIGQTISKSIQITLSASTALVWSDEFDVPGAPNTSKWGYDIGTGSGGWGNNELQYYTNRSQNAVVSGGTLKINLLKETFSGSNYTSARLLTKDKFSVKYGKIEARAKLPAGLGTWPAIWMLGNNISSVGWPACGEIDIMEHRGSELNKIWGTLHYPGRSGANPVGGTVMINNATTEFHNYAVEWNASSIKFYVDDSLYFTFANSTSVPYNHNFFILLNVAMGGNFGGSVDPNFSNATMEVDYIRVYQ